MTGFVNNLKKNLNRYFERATTIRYRSLKTLNQTTSLPLLHVSAASITNHNRLIMGGSATSSLQGLGVRHSFQPPLEMAAGASSSQCRSNWCRQTLRWPVAMTDHLNLEIPFHNRWRLGALCGLIIGLGDSNSPFRIFTITLNLNYVKT